ncbi:MAG: hypothetical protein LH616_12010 [Ilumatobacteraceae bacterium]|nr:hypothetical protein [Ilumatobacteraceae bacterium]
MTARETLRTSSIWAHVIAALVAVMLIMSVTLAARLTDVLVLQLPFFVLIAVFIVVGWLLAARRPDNPLGWLLLTIPGLFSLGAPAVLLGEALLESAPTETAWLFWFGYDRPDSWVWLPPIGLLLTQIPLRFPTGQLPSPAWRWFSGFTIAALVIGSLLLSTASVEVAPGIPNPAYIDGIGDSLVVPLTFGALAIAMIGSLASLFVRARRAGSVEAAQLRWMLWSVTIIVLVLIANWVGVLPNDDGWGAAQSFVPLMFGLIPVSIAVAVMRYRLYEIDRIISRTAAYALVTLVVVGVYALIVTSVAWLLPDAPTLGVALATLTAAAVFLPVLRTVRRLLDRRFNRAQYDAERVVESFGERLRTGADPHTAPVDLLGAVERTLEPNALGLWTAPPPLTPRPLSGETPARQD